MGIAKNSDTLVVEKQLTAYSFQPGKKPAFLGFVFGCPLLAESCCANRSSRIARMQPRTAYGIRRPGGTEIVGGASG
jgi:hypothetical protein